MAACNIIGIKCILCSDPDLPSAETTELGTVIITLNPDSKQGINSIIFWNKLRLSIVPHVKAAYVNTLILAAQITITFDNFHQPEFGPTSFVNYDV